MINTVKSRAEIEKKESRDEPRIKCYDNVIANFEDSCFSRMEAAETRLNNRKKRVRFNVI